MFSYFETVEEALAVLGALIVIGALVVLVYAFNVRKGRLQGCCFALGFPNRAAFFTIGSRCLLQDFPSSRKEPEEAWRMGCRYWSHGRNWEGICHGLRQEGTERGLD